MCITTKIECPICYNTYYKNETETVTTKCNHTFCNNCFIKLKIFKSTKCPLCRRNIFRIKLNRNVNNKRDLIEVLFAGIVYYTLIIFNSMDILNYNKYIQFPLFVYIIVRGIYVIYNK